MRRAIAAFGRFLVATGLLILAFVAFQLWGTGIVTARAQDDLRAKLDHQLATTTTTTTPRASTTTSTTVPAPAPPGAGLGIIRIPKIGVDKVFVEGTAREDLKKGPGHYPGTPLPGQIGNAAIAGHRTTYGQPFYNLDELVPGDTIQTTSVLGRFTYTVREKLVVKPTDTYVVDPTKDAELTLTTCNPKYSAKQRLVIKATLVPQKSSTPVVAPPPPTKSQATLSDGLDGETKPLGPAYGWGIIAAIVGLLWWWGFRRWPHPATWIAGLLPFIVVLFGFYYFLERVLPAGY
jgi:sortase A